MLGFCLFWVGLNFHSAILARAGQPPLSTSEDQERAKTVSAATVVFTGSSSIAYWETLEDDMKPLKVINTAKTSLGYPATLWGKPGYCPVLLGSFLSI
jgi:hypothetical protein